jgi:hypothetical protein
MFLLTISVAKLLLGLLPLHLIPQEVEIDELDSTLVE